MHPELELVGVMDRDEQRANAFASYYSVPRFRSLDELLIDRRVELVVNLTNPRSHYSVSRACLIAGKHVYSEKPLAMSFPEAEELVALAEQKSLLMVSAPSRILAETAQTMWKALRENTIGEVRLAYAEMDGGLIHRTQYKKWLNEMGTPWPYKDEFEVGCTIEHAGYPVTWLTAFFGPVESVTAFASCQVADKGTDVALDVSPPDFSVACLRFASGVVARLTSSWIAPSNHSLRIFGDQGILITDDIWRPKSSVYIKRYVTIGSRTILSPWNKRYPLVRPPAAMVRKQQFRIVTKPRALVRAIRARLRHLRPRVDFCLGIAELAASVREGRACRLSGGYCLHNNEIVLAIHNALEGNSTYRMKTSFKTAEPMPWAV
jgi:predicted dehydrogenase